MQEKFDQNSITEQAKSHTNDLGSFSAMTHISGSTVTIIHKDRYCWFETSHAKNLY